MFILMRPDKEFSTKFIRAFYKSKSAHLRQNHVLTSFYKKEETDGTKQVTFTMSKRAVCLNCPHKRFISQYWTLIGCWTIVRIFFSSFHWFFARGDQPGQKRSVRSKNSDRDLNYDAFRNEVRDKLFFSPPP
ncbi:hypothetical protein TNIN_386511 [Trichonephila inaurata madagascariensis]|uniref:Uncharacterized protein n=1 Tax=Trichonephila inaurata madagascariensis TaxID=2747483 RepID=A0A8X6XRS3_9ARAC|nr:hypothetical protein TNIN_386511 [Trichonephila inaurata madagascariensis]